MPEAPEINWDDVQAEIVSVLREYIRIDTTNPPGNEEPAARFLGEILEREGYDCEYIDAEPGRTQLRTRLQGSGNKQPLMLLNHTDVVPAQREFWDVDPFEGVIKDDCVWGRGALDMKGMGVLELMVMLLFKRHGIQPARDLIFLAVADEETGSSMGIEWLDSNRPAWLSEPEFAINEGGMGTLNFLGANRPVFAAAPAEKGPLWLKLRAEGRPGHGSVPHGDNSVEKLARALIAIQDWERAMTVQPITEQVIAELRRADAWAGSNPTPEELAQRHPAFRAAMMNTVSPTTLTGGIKHNVIPAFTEATLDCRLLPGEDHDAFIDQMRDVIDDPDIAIDTVMQSESGFSDFETELVGIMHDVVTEQVEGALLVPMTTVGFTDSRVLRRRGVQSYGFVPTLMDSSLAAGIHGHNERVPIESLRTGIQILFEVVRRFTA